MKRLILRSTLALVVPTLTRERRKVWEPGTTTVTRFMTMPQIIRVAGG